MVVAATCIGAGGTALGAAAGQSPRAGNAGGAATTSPETIPFTSTQTTSTQTTTTQTTTPATPPVPKLSVCMKRERAVVADRLHVRLAGVGERQRAGSNGMPQCNYLVRHAHGTPPGRVVVVVNVDNGPQPLWRLMRKVVEAGQIFGPIPPGWKPPLGLSGLGPYASWFSNIDQLMADTHNHKYLLTVSIVWSHAKRSEKISLARAAIAPYWRVGRFPA